MRKLVLLLIVAVAIWGATSWTATPQWRVIIEAHQINGSKQFEHLVFNASATAYRITASCTAIGSDPASQWTFEFDWKDVAKTPQSFQITCGPGQVGPAGQATYIITPKTGTPVSLFGNHNHVSSNYFGFYTVEELM